MNEQDLFLMSILENWDDDTPRYIFSDWLEERGDPWGEFIRLQLSMQERPYSNYADTSEYKRCKTLRVAHGHKWLHLLHDYFPARFMWHFRRGFPALCNTQGYFSGSLWTTTGTPGNTNVLVGLCFEDNGTAFLTFRTAHRYEALWQNLDHARNNLDRAHCGAYNVTFRKRPPDPDNTCVLGATKHARELDLVYRFTIDENYLQPSLSSWFLACEARVFGSDVFLEAKPCQPEDGRTFNCHLHWRSALRAESYLNRSGVRIFTRPSELAPGEILYMLRVGQQKSQSVNPCSEIKL